jgi:hypothetical protein
MRPTRPNASQRARQAGSKLTVRCNRRHHPVRPHRGPDRKLSPLRFPALSAPCTSPRSAPIAAGAAPSSCPDVHPHTPKALHRAGVFLEPSAIVRLKQPSWLQSPTSTTVCSPSSAVGVAPSSHPDVRPHKPKALQRAGVFLEPPAVVRPKQPSQLQSPTSAAMCSPSSATFGCSPAPKTHPRASLSSGAPLSSLTSTSVISPTAHWHLLCSTTHHHGHASTVSHPLSRWPNRVPQLPSSL